VHPAEPVVHPRPPSSVVPRISWSESSDVHRSPPISPLAASKLVMRVRFPSPALRKEPGFIDVFSPSRSEASRSSRGNPARDSAGRPKCLPPRANPAAPTENGRGPGAHHPARSRRSRGSQDTGSENLLATALPAAVGILDRAQHRQPAKLVMRRSTGARHSRRRHRRVRRVFGRPICRVQLGKS
jgi:hypothetical protein